MTPHPSLGHADRVPPRSTATQAWVWLRRAAWSLAMLAVLVAAPSPALAELQVQMTADRNAVALGDRVVVQIQVSTRSLDRPDITLPEFHGFEVIQQSVQRPTHFSFGLGGGQQVRSSVHYTFVLTATQEGQVVIEPVIAVMGKERVRSQPLTITVTPAGAAGPQPGAAQPPVTAVPEPPAAAPQVEQTEGYVHAQQVDPEAFIRTVIDKAEPYEREQTTVTLYLYTRERLQIAPTVDQEASTDGFWTQDLLDGKALERLPMQRVGRIRYNVYLLRRMAAFPLRSGELTIGAMSLTIQRPQNLFDIFGRGKPAEPLSRTGVPITLQVRALPEEGRPKGDVAVGQYEIETALDRAQSATGDAVTLTAIIKGRGHIQSVRLPDPSLPGLQVLEPQIRDLVETENDRVGGTRKFEWLLVPQQPGTYALPPFAIHTFDPESGTYAEIEGPQVTLTAAGRAVAEMPPDDRAVATGNTGEGPTTGDDALPKFGPVRTHSALLRAQQPLHTHPWFPFALLLPPLSFAGLRLRDRLRDRARNRRDSSSERAHSAASAHIAQAERAVAGGDSARFHAELASALVKMTEARMDEPLGGYTRPELQRHLCAQGMDEALARALIQQLERCDQARFSPGLDSPADLRSSLEKGQAIYEQLKGFERRTPAGDA